MKIIDYLKRFNRKERYHLISKMLGHKFSLDDGVFTEILTKIELDESLPQEYFSGMDYHLDWIFASIVLAVDGRGCVPRRNTKQAIKGTIEDIDFIIAFEAGDKTHIIMIEAKGDAHFSNQQMTSKLERLTTIFRSFKGVVVPHLLTCSPKEPTDTLKIKSNGMALD